MLRRPFVFGVVGSVFALGVRPSWAADQMRISLDTNPTHVRNTNTETFATRVHADIPRVAPQIFPSAQLFRDRDVPRALRQGAVEMGIPGWWQLDGIASDAALPSLPMFYGLSAELLYKIMDGPAGQQINRKLEERLRVKVLGRWFDLGGQHFYSTSKPLNGYADLQGLRIRHPGGSANAARIRTLGANPVLVPWPDVPLALSQNTVDGLITTHESSNTAKLWDAGVKYCFEDNQTFNQYIPMVSQAFWAKLNAEEQRKLVTAWEATVDKERTEAAAAQIAARDVLLRNGITIKTAAPDEVAEARQRLMTTQDQVVGEIGMDRELVAGVLREIRASGVRV
ncbi:TRAP transporter substrate-binding protein DctP [Roseomonas sp. HJA6]|uniref:TRAP transporter substrate-binding protein DctP n=1 Tax=Roseomonas alba TaxID=2846776 RepID=A0ABS7A2X4_9PROT|nr:TRAP transporter substrate-binding protein DctP [Neoroseomonas alba]MBW6396518.1 TRAP transporter substrate-binding protein DctP [Neoroseomonas alba]